MNLQVYHRDHCFRFTAETYSIMASYPQRKVFGRIWFSFTNCEIIFLRNLILWSARNIFVIMYWDFIDFLPPPFLRGEWDLHKTRSPKMGYMGGYRNTMKWEVRCQKGVVIKRGRVGNFWKGKICFMEIIKKFNLEKNMKTVNMFPNFEKILLHWIY